MKILVQKFRVNDLINSEGKQIEFGKDNFNELVNNKKINEEISLFYRSNDELNNTELKVICRYIPDKVNYKLYQLGSNTTLKSFFLDTLHLSLENNSEDFFTLSYLKENKFEFSYIKHDSPIGEYFSKMKLEGKIIGVNNNVNNFIPLNKPFNRIIFGAPGTGKSHKLEIELSDFPSLTEEFQRNDIIEKLITEEIKIKSASGNGGDGAASVAIKYSLYFKKLEKWFNSDGPGGAYNDFLNRTFNLTPKQPELMVAAYRGMNLNRETTVTETFERVTFHPNYSYAQFVGTYKPITKESGEQKQIEYEYVPGPFIRTLIKAYKTKVNCLLLIEEINRANVAAVFGDVFQLLDRDEYGNSEYPITTSEDLRNFLAKPENLGGIPEDYKTISIPSNMYIWATMNSADQGVQPMDAAFKRRWEFEYLNINNSEKDIDINMKQIQFPDDKYDWNQLRHLINNRISNNYNVNEDKLLGPFFIKKGKQDDTQFIESFKSKVLMYLFEDVCKINPKALFAGISKTKIFFSDVIENFNNKGIGIFNFSDDEKQTVIKETGTDNQENITEDTNETK